MTDTDYKDSIWTALCAIQPMPKWLNKQDNQAMPTDHTVLWMIGKYGMGLAGKRGTTMHWQGLQCVVEEVREVRGPLTCMLGPRRSLCWWCCRWVNASLGLCTPAILAWCLRSWMRSRVSSSGCSQARVLEGPERNERKYLRTTWAVH